MTIQKSKEEIIAQMTADAELAKEEFESMLTGNNLDDGTIKVLPNWWGKWFLKAGHKRLAYILMDKKLPGE